MTKERYDAWAAGFEAGKAYGVNIEGWYEFGGIKPLIPENPFGSHIEQEEEVEIRPGIFVSAKSKAGEEFLLQQPIDKNTLDKCVRILQNSTVCADMGTMQTINWCIGKIQSLRN